MDRRKKGEVTGARRTGANAEKEEKQMKAIGKRMKRG